MIIRLQRTFMSVYVFAYLMKRTYTLRKAEKHPEYWIKAQNKQIKKFVNKIYGIPFYRRRFEEAGLLPEDIKCAEDFKKLPPLTKEEYRAWLLEETADKEKYKYWMNRKTTGSSGTPLELYSLPQDRAAEIANLFRCAILQRKGYNPILHRVFSTMTPKPKAQKRFSIPYNKQMSSISTPEELVNGYNEAKPDFYYGNKSAVLAIAEYALKNHIKLYEPMCAGSISELLDDNARRIINEAFGENKLFDIYGCAEIGNFAVEKVGEPGKHIIWNDTHIVNLANEAPVEDVENHKIGQAMITSLIHYGFPLVNYVVGDTVEVLEEDGVRYIMKIHGRTNDVIKNEDGTSYQWMHVNRIMFGITDVTQFRLVQKDYNRILFVLAANDDMSDERKKEIEELILERSIALFGGEDGKCSKELSYEWHDRIPPDPNGKIRILVSEV